MANVYRLFAAIVGICWKINIKTFVAVYQSGGQSSGN